MKISLAIDVGNTRSKLAVFHGDQLVQKEVWEKLERSALETAAYNHRVENVILSSVANVPPEVEDFLKNNFFYLPLTTQTSLPIKLLYATPETLGKDRVAAAAGAYRFFPGENCLIVDAGTCITSDLLTAGGEFLGGNISPGIDMRLRAMHQFTARLPLVQRKALDAEPPYDILGWSTESAIRNGAQLGATLEIDALAEICKQRFSPLKVILTGGDADYFAKTLKTKIFAHLDLVLVGLNKILEHNLENGSQ
jgi:type III pantothenate kinase